MRFSVLQIAWTAPVADVASGDAAASAVLPDHGADLKAKTKVSFSGRASQLRIPTAATKGVDGVRCAPGVRSSPRLA